MKASFVFIFRKGNRTLSEEEQKRRTEEVRAWALQEGKAHDLEPRVLGDESYYLGESDKGSTGDGTVIALNFIKAKISTKQWRLRKAIPAFVTASASRCGPGLTLALGRRPVREMKFQSFEVFVSWNLCPLHTRNV
ncbi:MAG TPA: hypothetical protein VGJ66_07035 [Pyrinomonadaceae bacterium]